MTQSKVDNNYQCAVCGRRKCVHKDNDRPMQPEELADPNCNRCMGTGMMRPSHPVYDMKIPGRNDKCPCGSGKKYKHCCETGVRGKMDEISRKPCTCVLEGYGRHIDVVVNMPCSICGQEGYCEHRPSLQTILARMANKVLPRRDAVRDAVRTVKKAVDKNITLEENNGTGDSENPDSAV